MPNSPVLLVLFQAFIVSLIATYVDVKPRLSNNAGNTLSPTNFRLESNVGDIGVCLSQTLDCSNVGNKDNIETLKKSIIVLGTKFDDELPSQIIPKEIIRNLCTNWKPSTMALAIDPRRIDCRSKTTVSIRQKFDPKFELQSFFSAGFIIPSSTVDYYRSKRKPIGTVRKKFFGAISSRIRAQFLEIKDSIRNVLAPSSDLASMENIAEIEDDTNGNSNGNSYGTKKREKQPVGLEIPVGAQEFLDTAQDIKSRVLLADRDSMVTMQAIQSALARTPEFEIKVAELDVHCIDLEDTVGSGRKEVELRKLLRRLGSAASAMATTRSMETHLPAVYSSVVKERVEYIADAVTSLNDTRTFLLVPQYLLPSLVDELIAADFVLDAELSQEVEKTLLRGQFLRAVPTPADSPLWVESSSANVAEEDSLLHVVGRDVEQVVMGADLKRIIDWLVHIGRAVIPLRGSGNGNGNGWTPADEDEPVEKSSGGGDRAEKQDALFQKVTEYQQRHCWVYDESLVGKRGNYDK